MNAVLKSLPTAKPEVQFEPLTALWLDEVMQIEQQAYAHPWSRANFADSIQTGYQMQVLTLSTVPTVSTASGASADDKQPILGYFVAMKGFEEVHLLNITVAPEYQGRGWARAMLEALAVWSRGQAAEWLWLEVRASNTRALKVYKDHGFNLVSVRQDYYPAGPKANGREDAIVMSLKL
ncbi:MAG: ribosomal protein S18-alanine N-acetyltransferase [Burkholderiaceae bacterium]